MYVIKMKKIIVSILVIGCLLTISILTGTAYTSGSQNIPGWPVIHGDPMWDGHNSWAIGDVGFTEGNEAVTTINALSCEDSLIVVSNDGEILLDFKRDGLSNHVPSLGDLDNDGVLEIVVGYVDDFEGGLFVIDDGVVTEIASGYQSSLRPVVLEDLDGDGVLEIIEIELEQGIIHVRDRFGNDIDGWPQQPLVPTHSVFPKIDHSCLAVGDLDNDGEKEIVVQLKDARTLYAPWIFVLNSDGSIKWSVQIPSDYDYPTWNTNFALYFNEVILGDVDNDGFLEIVYFRDKSNMNSDDQYFYIFDHEGSIQEQWIIPTSVAYFGNPANQQIALGDLDQDGDLELVMSARLFNGNADRTFAWHHNGDLVDGFPITMLGEDDDQTTSPMIAADVDNDGFPITMLGEDDDQTTSPMIADVDNDGFPDIVSSLYSQRNNYYNKIYAWDNQGQLLDDWPKELIRQGSTPQIAVPPFQQTTLADLDGSGTLDLIAPIGGAESHAIDLGVAFEHLDWPMYRHDVQRTGRYIRNQDPNALNAPTISGPASGYAGTSPFFNFLQQYPILNQLLQRLLKL